MPIGDDMSAVDIKALQDRGESYIAGVQLLFETNLKNSEKILALENLKTEYNPQRKEDLYALLHALQEVVKDALSLKNLEKAHKLIVDCEAISAAQTYENRYKAIRVKQDEGSERAKDNHLHRQDFVVTTLTKEQEKEWLKILESEPKAQPQWFLKLDPLVQNVYKARVQAYQDDKDKNLGDYIGFQPATVRKTPGSANCWAQKITDKDGKVSYKVRSAYVVPCDMFKGRRLFSNTDDIVKATADNIKQQLALALYLKMAEKLENGETKPTITDFTLLLQNLISLPLQPGVKSGIRGTYALYAAIDAVKKELATEEGKAKMFESAQQFSHQEFGLDEDKKAQINTQLAKSKENAKEANLDLVFSHHAVNKIRGISTLLMSIPEAFRGIKRLFSGEKGVSDKISEIKQSIDPNTTDEKQKKILAAIAQHESIHYSTSTFAGFRKKHTWNTNAERAALEQIIMEHAGAGKDYARAGSCVSGKDREEMVGLMKIAMEEVYNETKAFPPAPGKPDPGGVREKFENRLADLFIKKYGPSIADMNAPGSNGLKNILDVLGKSVCEKIDKKAGTGFWKGLQKAADTNKVKFKKTVTKEAEKASPDTTRQNESNQQWSETSPVYMSPGTVASFRQETSPYEPRPGPTPPTFTPGRTARTTETSPLASEQPRSDTLSPPPGHKGPG